MNPFARRYREQGQGTRQESLFHGKIVEILAVEIGIDGGDL